MRRGIRHNLLFLLATIADLYGELSPHLMYKRLWWPDYKLPSVYIVVSKMMKVGEIERGLNRRGEAVIRLKARGGRLLDEIFPFRKLQQRTWDRRWRLVVFDIPERQKVRRELLRAKLRSLGFGMWQKSVYVSPHDVMREMNEYLQDHELFPFVVCFESTRTGFGDVREFANEVFATEKRNSIYLRIADDADELWHSYTLKKIDRRRLVKEFRKLWSRYLDAVNADPFLPFELLPKKWYADEARQWMRRLTSIL